MITAGLVGSTDRRSRRVPTGCVYRCGSASTRSTMPRAGELADEPARTPARHRARARASIPSASPTDETSSVIGSSARELRARARRSPATRNTGAPTGKPAAARRLALVAVEPIGVARDQRLHGRIVRRGAPARSRGRAGRAHATASIQVVSARSRAARPGRRAARSASRIATRSSSPGPRSRTPRDRPTSTSPLGRQPRRVPGAAAGAPGPARRAPAHSSTRSAPPRRSPKSIAPHERAPPRRLAHDAPDRSLPRAQHPAARRAGRRLAARAADLRDPVPGQRREQERPRRGLRSARTSRGARPSGPGRTTSTGGQLRRGGATSGRRARAASDDGAERRRARTIAPLDRGARQRDVAHVVVRRAILAMCAGGTLETIRSSPRSAQRREHRRPRADHDVVAPRGDLQPGPVARTLGRRRGAAAARSPKASATARAVAGTGVGLRHEDERAPSGGEARADGLDGAARLVLRRGAQDERAAALGVRERPQQNRSAAAIASREPAPIDVDGCDGVAGSGGRAPSSSSETTRGGSTRPSTAASGAT